jgi:hypothetical protein
MRMILSAVAAIAAAVACQSASLAETMTCTDVTDPSRPVACDLGKMEKTWHENEFRFERDYKGHRVAVLGNLMRVEQLRVSISLSQFSSLSVDCYSASSPGFVPKDAADWSQHHAILVTGEIIGFTNTGSSTFLSMYKCEARKVN